MASNPMAMASNLIAMASNLRAMTSNLHLLAMASNLIAMVSNLLAIHGEDSASTLSVPGKTKGPGREAVKWVSYVSGAIGMSEVPPMC